MVLRFWPGGISPTTLFVCSALGIIPVAGWIGRATEALAARVGEGWEDCSTPLLETPRSYHRRHRSFQRSDQCGESLHYGIDHR